ncbi:calcium-binding protein [Puniceibacterium confluentis]|uniref:calcium-binding protein n=1 Tax=Puniceibacterium confluentis TaxID=1958944 RepID=UPI0011B72940|nr:calcium-binding protein [Puniceibacterium confluentis]
MLINYFGPNNYYVYDAFFDFGNGGDIDIALVSSSPTRLVLERTTGPQVTTFTGTGFRLSSDGDPVDGTITGIDFRDSGALMATFSDISWSLVDFNAALGQSVSGFDPAALGALLSQSPVTVDASTALGALDMDDFEVVAPFVTSAVTILGTPGDDELVGGTGNDSINPGANFGYDRIHATAGNDTYDLSAANDASYYEIEYDGVAGPVTVTANTGAGSLSVTGAFGTDSFTNVSRAFGADEGGFGVIGTRGNDVFDVTHAPGNWLALSGGAGNDTFNLDISESLRVFYSWDGADGPTQGIVANLATGVVSNDGLGGRDTINVTGSGRLEIRATDFADRLTGSDRNESFITEQGNDTVDGGGGQDRVRYDRSGVGPVNVDLAAGTASGTWDGFAFTDTLISVEYIRGSRDGNDTLRGSGADERLEGMGGNDLLVGLGGDDELRGGDGNDTLRGGDGRDRLEGGDGNDLLDASGGDAASQGVGDYIRPGLGADTVLGHEGLFNTGNGIDVSYATVSGTGGLLVTRTANGSATVTSNTAGRVSDTITFAHTLEGSAEADLLDGSAGGTVGRAEWIGGDGDDTIIGTPGTDALYFGDDVYSGGDAPVSVTFTGVGVGTARDGHGSTDIFSGIEEIEGTAGNDSMTGAEGNDVFFGYDGNDLLAGGAGDDTIHGGNGTDTAVLGVTRASVTATATGDGGIAVSSAEGEDLFLGIERFQFTDGTVSASVLLTGDEGPAGDTITGTDGDDSLDGTDAADTISGGAGNDTLNGGAGDDVIAASEGDDSVDGGPGNDSIGGGPGDDVIFGSEDDDVIGAGQGNDQAFGGGGNDIVNGGPGDDTLIGGDGDDTMGASFGNDLVEGNGGNDSLGGGTGRDTLRGGDGADSIGGGEGDDSIEGGDGNDFLAGGGRDDIIDGGAGNDAINGGAGDDTMTGGAGADRFIFNGFNDGDLDVITDFQDGVDSFRMTGVENAPGTGLAGKLAALNITDTATGVSMEHQGHVIEVLGVSAADLTLDDFSFL